MIEFDISGHSASIALARPAKRNALDEAGWSALADAVMKVARSDARVLVVGSAAPGSFCAGSDLASILRLIDHGEERAEFRAMMRAALDGLRALPIPTLAAVDGDCFGAGVALALACDIRFAGSNARFAVTPAKLGLSYPQQDVALLVQAVGRAQAARLLFGAQPIDAAEAARIGLVQEAGLSGAELAQRFGEAIAGNAPSSLVALKRMLRDEPAPDNPAADRAFDACFDSEALREGVAALQERRPSRF